MALTRVTNNGLDPNDEFSFNGLNVTGVVTATSGVGTIILDPAGNMLKLGNATMHRDSTTGDTIIMNNDGAYNPLRASKYLINTNTVIDSSRNINAGVLTATTLYGDGSNLSGIDATQIQTGNTSVQTVDTGSDGHVKINTEGTERLRITSAGDVGIGFTNPLGKLHVRAADECNFIIREEATALVLSAETNSGRDNNRLMTLEGNGAIFNTNGTERVRITAAGDVGIGTNNPQRRLDVLETASQTVAQIRTAGQTKALTRYQCLGDNPVFVGAARSDFSIEMSGTDVMTIDHSNNNVEIAGNLKVASGKGINFGATQGGGATSDLLDDYEEGTWTPVPQGATTAGSVTAGTISGQYIKIGKLVYATVRMENVTFSGSVGIIRIAGLPFTVANVNAYAAHAWGMTYRISFNSSLNQAWYANPSSNYIYGIESGSGVAWASMVSSNFHNSVMYMNQCVVYEATS